MTRAALREASDAAVLGALYARNKALSLSIGASLALRGRPAEAVTDVYGHLEDCEEVARRRSGAEFSEHFIACRDAAVDLVALVTEVEPDLKTPSRERIAAARASHRRLRRLVWDVFDCEYTPCGHERSHR